MVVSQLAVSKNIPLNEVDLGEKWEKVNSALKEGRSIAMGDALEEIEEIFVRAVKNEQREIAENVIRFLEDKMIDHKVLGQKNTRTALYLRYSLQASLQLMEKFLAAFLQ